MTDHDTDATPSAPTWRPYQRLLPFFRSKKFAPKAAWKRARSQARQSFPDQEVRFAKPSRVAIREAQNHEMTESLLHICRRERPVPRIRLDRLILAYAQGGYPREQALEEIILDYNSMRGVPPLTEDEIDSYAFLFWAFLSLPDRQPGVEYLEAIVPNSEELAIYRGDHSLGQVRADCFVRRDLHRHDYGGDVAVEVGGILQRLTGQLRNDVGALEEADTKVVKDRAMLLSRLSLAQDRLRRHHRPEEEAKGEDSLGLDELLKDVERGRERRREESPDVPWNDPDALIRSPGDSEASGSEHE